MKLKKLNTRGFSHDLLIVAFVVIFAVTGVGYIVSSHAQSVQNPVGAGPNRALAVEAVKYNTASTGGKYRYLYGGLHGPHATLVQFQYGGGTDCSGFVRYVIWKVYGRDLGNITTKTIASPPGTPNNPNFIPIRPADVMAGDIGWVPDNGGHVDFITLNRGNGSIHQFGAHSPTTNIHGGDAKISSYKKYFRYNIKPSPAVKPIVVSHPSSAGGAQGPAR